MLGKSPLFPGMFPTKHACCWVFPFDVTFTCQLSQYGYDEWWSGIVFSILAMGFGDRGWLKLVTPFYFWWNTGCNHEVTPFCWDISYMERGKEPRSKVGLVWTGCQGLPATNVCQQEETCDPTKFNMNYQSSPTSSVNYRLWHHNRRKIWKDLAMKNRWQLARRREGDDLPDHRYIFLWTDDKVPVSSDLIIFGFERWTWPLKSCRKDANMRIVTIIGVRSHCLSMFNSTRYDGTGSMASRPPSISYIYLSIQKLPVCSTIATLIIPFWT